MKKTLSLIAVCFLALASIAATLVHTRDVKIDNTTDTVALTIQKGAITSNIVEAFVGSTLTFKIPSTGIIPIANGGTASSTAAAAKTAFGIQSGSVTTAEDGTVTNTFSPVFTSVPVVVLTQLSDNGVTNRLTTLATNKFVYNGGASNVVAKWIAIGAP